MGPSGAWKSSGKQMILHVELPNQLSMFIMKVCFHLIKVNVKRNFG